MKLKTLQIGTDLREYFPYSCNSAPLTICTDNFDDYFHREWGCHWHDEIEFGIVQKGIVQFTVFSGQEQLCKELHQGDGIFINSACLHSAKALVPDTVIAEFALPVAFFQKHFENSAHRIVQPVTKSEVAVMICKAQNADDKTLLSGIQEICTISDKAVLTAQVILVKCFGSNAAYPLRSIGNVLLITVRKGKLLFRRALSKGIIVDVLRIVC